MRTQLKMAPSAVHVGLAPCMGKACGCKSNPHIKPMPEMPAAAQGASLRRGALAVAEQHTVTSPAELEAKGKGIAGQVLKCPAADVKIEYGTLEGQPPVTHLAQEDLAQVQHVNVASPTAVAFDLGLFGFKAADIMQLFEDMKDVNRDLRYPLTRRIVYEMARNIVRVLSDLPPYTFARPAGSFVALPQEVRDTNAANRLGNLKFQDLTDIWSRNEDSVQAVGNVVAHYVSYEKAAKAIKEIGTAQDKRVLQFVYIDSPSMLATMGCKLADNGSIVSL